MHEDRTYEELEEIKTGRARGDTRKVKVVVRVVIMYLLYSIP